jgi:hypothetical protein
MIFKGFGKKDSIVVTCDYFPFILMLIVNSLIC